MKTPDSGNFLKITKPTHPAFLAAEAKAKSLVEQASFNEAIRVIDQLRKEVSAMRISDRFSRTKKPSENLSLPVGQNSARGINPMLSELTEDEYKRQTLLIDLDNLKGQILSLTSSIEHIVMDIEATKTDYIIPGKSK